MVARRDRVAAATFVATLHGAQRKLRARLLSYAVAAMGALHRVVLCENDGDFASFTPCIGGTVRAALRAPADDPTLD